MKPIFFKKELLPSEMLIEISEYFPLLKEIFNLSLVSKDIRDFIMSNNFWNQYLLVSEQIKDINKDTNDYPLAYVKFRDKPQFRRKFRYCGTNGKKQLDIDLKEAEKNNQITNDYQKLHLQSNIIRNMILNNEISLDKAIQRAIEQSVEGLNEAQRNGIKIGLTREQVNHSWFTETHIKWINEGSSYESIKGIKIRYYNDPLVTTVDTISLPIMLM